MIRPITLIVLCAFISMASLQAQDVGPYKLTVLQEGYQPLENATEIDFDDPWDDPEYIIPLEFDFKFFDYECDGIHSSAHDLYNSAEITDPMQSVGGLVPYLVDIIDRGFLDNSSQSPVRYQVEGTDGDRILKFEIANAGFYDDVYYGTSNSFVNYQFWLYENDGSFEYRYGPSLIEDPIYIFQGKGPSVGIVDSLFFGFGTSSGNWLFLTGDPSSPEITAVNGTLDDLYDEIALDEQPTDGTVYRFSIPDVAAKDIPAKDLDISILENPVAQHINLRVESSELINLMAEINISNALGQSVFVDKAILNNTLSIDVDHFSKGTYYITVTTENGFKTMKLVKS